LARTLQRDGRAGPRFTPVFRFADGQGRRKGGQGRLAQPWESRKITIPEHCGGVVLIRRSRPGSDQVVSGFSLGIGARAVVVPSKGGGATASQARIPSGQAAANSLAQAAPRPARWWRLSWKGPRNPPQGPFRGALDSKALRTGGLGPTTRESSTDLRRWSLSTGSPSARTSRSTSRQPSAPSPSPRAGQSRRVLGRDLILLFQDRLVKHGGPLPIPNHEAPTQEYGSFSPVSPSACPRLEITLTRCGMPQNRGSRILV